MEHQPLTSHYVYKFVLNDEVIYVGKSNKKTFERIFQHGKKGDNIEPSGWGKINDSDIYYCPLYNSTMADVIESALIYEFKPKYNRGKTKTEWNGFSMPELKWIPIRVHSSDEIQSLKEKIVSSDKINNDLSRKLSSLEHELSFLKNENIFLKQKNKTLLDRFLSNIGKQENIVYKYDKKESDPTKLHISKEEIGFLHKYYPVDGFSFESIISLDVIGEEQDRMSITFSDGKIIASSHTFPNTQMDDDGCARELLFPIPHCNFYPRDLCVYLLLKSLYSELLNEIKRVLENATDIAKNHIKNQTYCWMRFNKYPDATFRFLGINPRWRDEEEVVIRGYFPIVDENKKDISLMLSANDFIDKYGELLCFPDLEINTSKIEKRFSEIENAVKKISEINNDSDFNIIYEALHFVQNFRIKEKRLLGTMETEKGDIWKNTRSFFD